MNTGRTHFKKGMIPHNKGKSYFFKDLTNKIIGRLTVLSHTLNKEKKSSWLCKCSCGNKKIIRADQLKFSRSCGCLQKEYAKTHRINGGSFPCGKNHPNWKHGLSNTREYSVSATEKRLALKKANGGFFSVEQWILLKKKFNYMCLCCKKYEPEIKLEADHIVPLSVWKEWEIENKPKYKASDIENIQPLCRSCNSRKKSKIINYIENYE